MVLLRQTHEDDDVDVKTEGGEEANARKPMADKMKGELVGVNCDFAATIEVQVW